MFIATIFITAACNKPSSSSDAEAATEEPELVTVENDRDVRASGPDVIP